MGVTTARALQARRRGSATRIDRVIARAEERNPIGSVRRTRMKDAARRARRKVAALAAAQQAAAAIEVEIGRALLEVVGQGLSRNEAFELAGLSRHLGRRYLDLAGGSPTPAGVASSTASAAGAALPAPTGEVGRAGDRLPATPTERKP